MEPLELAQEMRKFEFSSPWEHFPKYRLADPSKQTPKEAESDKKEEKN